MRKHVKRNLALATALAVCGSAEAATITQSFSPSLGPNANQSTSGTFSYFNSALGTLTEVDLTIDLVTATLLATAFATTISPTQSVSNETASETYTVSGYPSFLTASFSFSTPSATVGSLPAGLSTIVSATVPSTNLGNFTATTGPGLASFIGGGSFAINFAGSGTVSGSTTSQAFLGESASASFNATLKYLYTAAPPPPVAAPAPATVMLLGAGLLGVGAWRRRRQR